MLCNERHTVLLKLLEGFALAFGFASSRVIVILDKGFEAEFNSNCHQVRVLCYGWISTNCLDKLLLLERVELYTPCLFNPHDLLLSLLIDSDKGAARDQ